MVTLVRVVRDRRWPFRRAFRAVVCSLIPFGAFVFDRSLRKEIASVRRTLDIDREQTTS
jgi:hypothetical protein